MKKVTALLTAALLIAAVSAPSSVFSQTIATGALSASAFCAGDSITVNYTITGTFGAKNAFTVQLSNDTGSFASFQNIGSVTKTTASGSIVAGIPLTIKASSRYRVRVIGSTPYSIGSDNGSDLTVGAKPTAGFGISSSNALTGDAITFTNRSTGGTSFAWDFGDGASPATSTDENPTPVSYSTPGAKTVKLTVTSSSGCVQTSSIVGGEYHSGLVVYSCNPEIPHSAQVDSVTKNYGTGSGYIWVQPGITFISNTGSFVVFAEAGSSVNLPGTGELTVYLKDGASYTGGATGGHVIIHSSGASLNSLNHETVLECSSVSFDYTNAPPNKIMFGAVSDATSPSVKLGVYPNPASTMLFVESAQTPQEVSLYNDLGQVVLSAQGGLTSKLQLNVSDLANGVYHLQLKYANKVETQKVSISH
jgi:PKD repeat protein